MEEALYFRESLGVYVRSSQLAHSYLDGRVDAREVFSVGEKKFRFSEILLCDEIVQTVVNTSDRKRFTPENKFDNFGARYDLFKKVVLHGDDAIAPLLVELRKKEEDILSLEKGLTENKIMLSAWKKNNSDLIEVCNNLHSELSVFAEMLNVQMSDFLAESRIKKEYSNAVLIARKTTEKIVVALQRNIVSATAQDGSEKDIQEISILNELRDTTEKELSNLRKETDLYVNEERNKLEAYTRSEHKKLENQKEEFDEHTNEVRTELYRERDNIIKDIDDKTNLLRSVMIEYGMLENKIRDVAKETFKGLVGLDKIYYGGMIPNKILIWLIKKLPDVSFRSILAFYDCSNKGESSGILVTTNKFYLIGGDKIEIFQIHSANVISVVKVKKRGFDLLFGWLSSTCDVAIVQNNSRKLSFKVRDVLLIKRFCGAINQICSQGSSMRLTDVQTAKIDLIRKKLLC